MSKVMFQNPPSFEDMKRELGKVGIQLNWTQEKFLQDHATHRGLAVESGRVYCRTCNKRDGQ